MSDYVTEGSTPIPICPMGRKKDLPEDDGGSRMDAAKLSPVGRVINPTSDAPPIYSKMLISNLLLALTPPPKPRGLKRLFFEAARCLKWVFGWSARRRESQRKKRMERLANRMSEVFLDTFVAIEEDSKNPYFNPEAYEKEWAEMIKKAGHKDDPVVLEVPGGESVLGGTKATRPTSFDTGCAEAVLMNSNLARMRYLLSKENLDDDEKIELKNLTELSGGDIVVLE